MKSRSIRRTTVLFTTLVLSSVSSVLALGGRMTAPPPGPQETPAPQERIAAIKQSLQESQKRLRQYEWIETTIISLKGEEKARKQNRCYYGADGKVQKIPIEGGQSESKGGRRGGPLKQKIVENKKDDMQDYMERAVALVHRYVPPNPAQIQAAKDGGKASLSQPAPGRAQIAFADFVQPGDRLTLTLDAAQNRILGLGVATYLDKKEDAVILDVKMATFPDGTTYTAQTTLDAKAKNIRVVIQNSGYKPQ